MSGSSVEYIIVGGGVHGCALAWKLSDRGAQTLVLEAGEVAAGASGGAGKRGVRASRRDVRELPLMRLAYPMWKQLADQLNAPTGYQRVGGLTLVEQETTGLTGGLVSLDARARTQRDLGIPTEILERPQLLELDPDVSPATTAALWCPLDGVADHTATTRAYAASARRLGAEIREHSCVTAVETSNSRAVSVTLGSGERIGVGSHLVLLNNVGAPQLAAAVGTMLPVWRVFPQALFLRTTETPACPHLVGHDHRPLSLKRLADDELMVSGGWRGRWHPGHQRGEPDPGAVDGNLSEARRVYPALDESILLRAEAATAESCAVDGIPIVDALPSVRNVLVGTGWCGHGFALAPAVTHLLADWLIDGQRPRELAPFTLDRFHV